jgi:hypothetical protein
MTITNARSKNFDFGAFAVPKKLVQNFEIQTVKIPVYTQQIKHNQNQKKTLLTKAKMFFGIEKKEETYKFSNLYNWEIKEVKVLKVELTGATVNFRSQINKEDIKKTMFILSKISKKDLPKEIQQELSSFLKFTKKLDAFELIQKNLTDIEDELKVHFQENGISVTTK